MGEDGELTAGHPGLGVRLQSDRHPVQLGDRAEDGPGVDVVGEQAPSGGEDSRAQVAGGELAELAGEHGDAEGRQFGPEQGDAVALQQRAQGVQAAYDGFRGGGRADDDHIAVLLGQGVEFGERLLQRALVEAAEHDGRHGPLVLCRQRHVGTGHGNGSWHAQLPALHTRRPTGVTPVRQDDFTA